MLGLRDVTVLLLVVLLCIGFPRDSVVAASSSHETRILGGQEVAVGEFPHQIYLLWNVTFFLGGGSILSRDWVLTCGHCLLFPASEITVVSGTNSLTEGGVVHASEKVIPHPGFVYGLPFPDDIGLIKVTPPFNLDGFLEAPVKLPAAGQQLPAKTPATIIGWGMMWEDGDIPDKMLKVDVSIRDHDFCDSAYGQLFNVSISERQVCADVPEGGKAPCKGDSGGPLLVDGQVVGIVSWANGCGRQGYPGVFSNVASYIDWINDNMV